MSKFRAVLLWLVPAILGQTVWAKAETFYGVSDERMQTASYQAASPYYQQKERGWFWYEAPPAEPEPEEEPPQTPDKPAPAIAEKTAPKAEGPKPLTSEWFRKNMEKYRDQAIDNPSPGNVNLYMYLQRVMLDKAEKFAEASQVAVMTDAALDENARRPVATFGAFAKDEMAANGTKEAVRQLAEMAGIWFFFRSDCTYCVKESGVLNGLMNTHGFKVMAISLDGLPLPNGDFKDFVVDQGQAKKMGVDTTPALFLVKPEANEGGVIQLGQGLLSGEEIVNRSITLAHQAGWLTHSTFDKTRKVAPIRVDHTLMQSVDDTMLANPKALVDKIRQNLRSQLNK